MSMENEKKLLVKEIENLNEEILTLSYKLNELLSVDCTFGVCLFDPEVENVHDKMKEVHEKKVLLERIKKNIDSCLRN